MEHKYNCATTCEYCGSDKTRLRFDFGKRKIVYCASCLNSFTSPKPSFTELSKVYNENYFSNEKFISGKIESTYGYQDYEQSKEDIREDTELTLRELAAFFNHDVKGKKLLDFGCGLGAFLNKAAQAGFIVEGIECNTYAANTIKEKYRYKIYPGTSLDVALKEGCKYDVVVMFDVIEHLLDPNQEFSNCYKLLNDNGILLVGTTDFNHIIPRLLGTRFEDFRRVQEHIFFFGKKNLISILEMSGFKNIKKRSQKIYMPLINLSHRMKGMNIPGTDLLEKLSGTNILKTKKLPVNWGMKYIAFFEKKTIQKQFVAEYTPPLTMKINVVIPVYNEESTIEKVIKKVLQVQIKNADIDLIVVDDGSTDCTRILLAELQKKYPFRLYLKPKNEGKGSALKVGFKHCNGDVVIIQDADLEYNPEDFTQLIKPIRCGDADVVYGSRFLSPERRVMGFWHTYGNKFLTFLCNMFINLNITDMETCYKVMKIEVAKSLQIKSKRFDVEPEVTCKLARQKKRIYEVPIKYHARTNAEGKKIGLKDFFQALWAIFKFGVLRLN